MFVQAEREVLAAELESLDVNVPWVVIDGRKHSRVLRGSETYTSAAGSVTVTRTPYRAGQNTALSPLELRAGIVDGHEAALRERLKVSEEAATVAISLDGVMVPMKNGAGCR